MVITNSYIPYIHHHFSGVTITNSYLPYIHHHSSDDRRLLQVVEEVIGIVHTSCARHRGIVPDMSLWQSATGQASPMNEGF